MPESVSQVITMGSPFRYRYREPVRGVDKINQLLGWHAPRTEWPEENAICRRFTCSSHIHLLATRWRSSTGVPVSTPLMETHENIRVYANHLGIGHDPSVMLGCYRSAGSAAGDVGASPPWYPGCEVSSPH